MTYTIPLLAPSAKKVVLFITFALMFAAPVAHASVVYNAVIDYSIALENDASANVIVNVISNGLEMNFSNPDPTTIYPLFLPGDEINVFLEGLANSGPTGSSTDQGVSITSASLAVSVIDTGGSGVSAGVAIASLLFNVRAEGQDAFTNLDGRINGTDPFDPFGFPVPLVEVNASSDTLFGCTLNFVDTGESSPCSVTDQISIEWVDLDLVSVPPISTTFSETNVFLSSRAISSTANYSATLSFALPATVPIPPAVLLFISGLIGMVSVARRKKAA